jgi:hypothetical protein
MFASFKHVNFSGRDPGRSLFSDRPVSQFDIGQMSGNGLLGQASLTLDYLFSRGRLGIFGSKGFLQDAVLGRFDTVSRNVFTEYYLRTVDQVGASTTLGLMGNAYLEANLGYLKSRANADRVGGTARFVFPFADRLAFTLEGGMNETLLSYSNTGRVVAGLQFGNFMRPKDYLEGYNGVQHAVPVDVPRVRYEIMTRTVRTGQRRACGECRSRPDGCWGRPDHARWLRVRTIRKVTLSPTSGFRLPVRAFRWLA